jgi:uncharacterized protein
MKYSLFFLLLILFSCNSNKEHRNFMDTAIHAQEIADWHVGRAEYLKSKEGWLNLAGLFWLKEGTNTFGSGVDNDFVFPENKIPEQAGYFLLNNGVVYMHGSNDVLFDVKGTSKNPSIIYHPDSPRITLDYHPLHWFVIKRENQYAIRLRDFENDALINFQAIERFPADVFWRVEGTFVKETKEKTLPIVNILGQNAPMKILGTLNFKIEGVQYSLIALDEGDGGDLFVIFADDTNARETYGAGRYLYVSWPEEGEEHVIIDFNKAFNPPCAFTDFATCPLPPKENMLPIAVTAGEKTYGIH